MPGLDHASTPIQDVRPDSLVVEPAKASTVLPALELLYSHLSASDRAGEISRFLNRAAQGVILLDDLIVARRGDRTEGVLLMVRQPGNMAFVFPPVTIAAAHDVPRRMIQELCRRLAAAGIRLAQCIRQSEDEPLGQALEESGFPALGRLLLVEREVHTGGNRSANPAAGTLPQGITWDPFTDTQRDRFATVIERSMHGSLDSPALTGFRTGAEVLDAHSQTGDVGTELWRIYRDAGRDVGVLLLADQVSENSLELLYVGVVPEARGRGLGHGMVSDALSLADRLGRKRVRLQVFDSNLYAKRIYASCGLVETAAMLVHVWLSGPKIQDMD